MKFFTAALSAALLTLCACADVSQPAHTPRVQHTSYPSTTLSPNQAQVCRQWAMLEKTCNAGSSSMKNDLSAYKCMKARVGNNQKPAYCKSR